MAMVVTVPPVLLVALQGKFDPSGKSGELLGLPYGGGEARTMCAWAVEVRAAMAEMVKMVLYMMCPDLRDFNLKLRWFVLFESSESL